MSRSMIAVAIAVVVTTAAFADTGKTTGQTVKKPTNTSAVTSKTPPSNVIASRPLPAGFHAGIPVRPDHPGVHINSVKIQGNCGQPATFVVEIQNNLRITANLGDVVVREKGDTSLRAPYSVQSRFQNLQPGEKRTITISTNSNFAIYCQGGELAGMVCYEVFITMEPDAVAAGQVWDGVYHTACAGTPTSGSLPATSDTPHK